MERYVKGCGAIGDYLFDIFKEYVADGYARSKEIWDIISVAWMVNADWAPTRIVHAPRLTDHRTWSADDGRHFMRVGVQCRRDPIFADLFRKLEAAG
jgi:hypothetical protein